MALGYFMAIVNVRDKVGTSYQEVVEHFQENTFSELVDASHVHLFGMPMMFALLGGIFLLTSVKENWKRLIVSIPFVAIVLDIGSFWLIRYVAPQFVILMIFSGMLMGTSFLVFFLVPIYEMWIKKTNHEEVRNV